MRHLIALFSVCACATSAEDPPVPEPIDPASSSCPAADIVTPLCGPLSSTTYLSLASRPDKPLHEVVVVDAATGSTCTVRQFAKSIDIDGVTSIASIGTDVYFCAARSGDRSGILTHMSLTDGTVEQATTECLSVTAYGGKLVVLRESGTTLELMESIGFWMSPSLVTLPAVGTILGFGDDRLYSTHPQPESVLIYEPSTQASTYFDMPFAFDSIGVMGLAAHGGALTILDGLPDTQYLLSIDATNGAEIERIPVGEQSARLHGLTNTCSGTAVFL